MCLGEALTLNWRRCCLISPSARGIHPSGCGSGLRYGRGGGRRNARHDFFFASSFWVPYSYDIYSGIPPENFTAVKFILSDDKWPIKEFALLEARLSFVNAVCLVVAHKRPQANLRWPRNDHSLPPEIPQSGISHLLALTSNSTRSLLLTKSATKHERRSINSSIFRHALWPISERTNKELNFLPSKLSLTRRAHYTFVALFTTIRYQLKPYEISTPNQVCPA